MSPWKIIVDVNLYFVTTTIVDWQTVFTAPAYFQILIKSLKHCVENKGLHLHGYVIMPTHAHYILSTDHGINLSNVMRDFNTHTSREITALLQRDKRLSMLRVFQRASVEDGRGNNYKVWQTGFHPIYIVSDWFYWEKLNYIHYNPVRSGLVREPEEWIYSSARNCILGDHSIIQVEFL